MKIKTFFTLTSAFLFASAAHAGAAPASKSLTPEQTARVAKLLEPSMKNAKTVHLRGVKGEAYEERSAQLKGRDEDGAACGVEIAVSPPHPGITAIHSAFPKSSLIVSVDFVDPASGISTVNMETMAFWPAPLVFEDGSSAELGAPSTFSIEFHDRRVVHARSSRFGTTVTELKFKPNGLLAAVRIESVAAAGVAKVLNSPLHRQQFCAFP